MIGCGTTTYTWDARNQLIGIDGFNTNCSTLTASFKYDALGRRIEKTVNGRMIQYLYDGLDIAQEIEDGVVSVNYIRTLNIDEPLARIEEDTGTIRYYQTDALGSIVALTDDIGNVVTQYGYSPFGEAEIIGELSDNPFQYTGRENDETGLYYYRARYYNPAMKRFISEDPIRFAGGINFYAYVGNSPVNWVDPWGLFGWDTVGRWIGKQAAKQIGKIFAKKILPDKGLNMPYEGDDDNDGQLNFMDPDSEHCQVNCTKPSEPSECK